MDKSDLRIDFLEFVVYLKSMAIIHDEHCHAEEYMETRDTNTNNMDKSSDAEDRSSGHNPGKRSNGGGSNNKASR
jgi:hypothetical protein